MTAIATNKFRIRNAENFINSVANASTPLYAFIGRPQSWLIDAPGGSNVSESSPRTPHDNRENESYTMQGIMSLKKVASDKVTHACLNRKWESGMNYNPYLSKYDGTVGVKNLSNTSLFYPTSLAEANYYVVSNGYVYICIEEGSGTSTVDPNVTVGTDYNVAVGADGYKWKLAAQASATEISSFETPEYFPVSNSLVNKSAQAALTTHLNPGGIYSIRVKTGGTNWGTTSIPAVAGTQIKVIGDGTGLQFSVNVSAGVITSINVTNPGAGYTYAKFILGDSLPNSGGATTMPELEAVITPKAGLGKDVVSDLNAYFVIVSNVLTGAEGAVSGWGGFTVTNDYRTIGLVSKPSQFGTSTPLVATVYDALTTLVLDTSVNINPDDIITIGSGRKGFVVDTGTVEAGNIVGDVYVGKKYLRVLFTSIENSGVLTGDDPIAVNDTVTNGVVNTSLAYIHNPGYEPQSGELLYIENRRPISRANDQNEVIRVVIEF